jgi:hypothetical protein
MPKGEQFALNVKQLMFRIIKFVESEKTGAAIPLFNTTGRLEVMLGISRRSIFKLRSEMYVSTMNDEQSQNDNMNESKVQLRTRALSETSTLPKGVRREKRKHSIDIPVAISPQKKGHSGRKVTEVTEQQQDNIRYLIF